MTFKDRFPPDIIYTEVGDDVVVAPADGIGVCDFCASPPLWEYPCRDFDTPAGGSLGGWASCAECAKFVDESDYRGLATRGLKVYGVQDPELFEALLEVYVHFDEHRTGPKIPIEPL